MTEEDDDEEYDTKPRMSGFSRGKLEAGRNGLGLCTTIGESKRCCCVFSRPIARRSRGVRRRFVPGSREISLVSSLHRVSNVNSIPHAHALAN